MDAVRKRGNTERMGKRLDLLDLDLAYHGEQLRAAVFDDLPGGVAILDGDGRVITVNEPWRRGAPGNALCDPMLGAGQDYLACCAAVQGNGAADAAAITDGLRAILAGSLERLTRVYSWHEGGAARWFRLTACRLMKPGFDGALIVHSDVTERMLHEQRILRNAQYDSLTTLPNHGLFQDRLTQACATARRDGTVIALLQVVPDDFGAVHERLGPEIGDRVIAAFGERLRDETRESDTVARRDADRFAVILTHLADGLGAANCANRLLGALRKPFRIDDHEIQLTTSVGIALYPADAGAADDLTRHAEVALREAKQRGGHSFRFFNRAINEQLHQRLDAEADLRGALERGEFVLHYLPKLSCATGQIIGAEALLRWCHPTRGMVAPAEFVPILEQSGLIAEVGAWVIRAACAQARQWHDAGFPDMGISVNVSGPELLAPGLPDQVRGTLAETQLPPQTLELELAESLMMQNPLEAGAAMLRLREIGVRLAIDNFGTGYSSLSHLKRLPVNSLKIDRSFIQDIVADPNDVSITRAIIQLAHQLRLEVAAEGVETESQLGLLIANGCDVIQGHFFSRACPADEITTMLRAGRGLPPDMLPSARGGRTLLLVDDEENIIAALRRLLRRSGYRVLTAGSAQEGLAVLARDKVDVIISDQRMPGMTGVEFLRRVKVIHPDTVRIVLSGYTELQSITQAINEGAIYKFLTKPWDEPLLLANIDEAFKHKDMIDDNRRLAAQIVSSHHELAYANAQLEQALAAQLEQATQ